ncbi:hypothetical protein WMY93_024812 [Mugilogobius chulae]|uniref:Ig-like domain-containing protein n=1 Tax=Mugilogobius chulae TaxID=88201 RepID=A0AAW0NAP2_9GOBI
MGTEPGRSTAEEGSLRPRHHLDSGRVAYNSYSYSQPTGDYERLEAIRFYYRERVCARPTAMEVRTTDWVSAAETGEVVHSSLDKGFWCVNKEQPHGRICSNYHVRFQCPPVQSYWSDWTEWGPCSTSLCNDVGIQTRHRKCLSSQPMPLLLVPACQGHHTDRRECSTPPCTAKWSPWGRWGACSVSCGGGRRVRRRTCVKNSPTVQCTGRPAEMQKCGKSPCPVKCEMSCSEGRPSEDCTRCVCDGHVLFGEVHSVTGVPVSGAWVTLPSQPKVVLARTNNKGQFNLPGVCSSSSTLVSIRKEKFAPVTVSATSNTTGQSWVKAVLKTAEKPYIVKHPEDKVRYEGGRVLLCCKATGSPLPDKYYWYHNGTLLDRKVYKYEEDLVLRDLKPEQSGHYYCKTSSSAGSIKSSPALLTLKVPACNSTPEPHLIRMPVDCVQPGTDSTFYNAGRCPHNKCAGSLDYDLRCRDGAGFCCSVQTMETRTIDCGSYSLPIKTVTQCSCQNVLNPQYWSEAESSLLTIMNHYDLVTSTSERKGLVLLAFKKGGSIYHDVKVMRKQEPIDLNAGESNSIDLGEIKGEDPIGQLVIPANSFHKDNGEVYEGTVKASVTFIDPRNITTAAATPGDLNFVSDDGDMLPLRTYGMFSVDFRDESNRDILGAGGVQVLLDTQHVKMQEHIPKMKLWSLNPETGVWEEEGDFSHTTTTSGRNKREERTFLIGNMEIRERRLFNLDVPENRRCYVKVRAYMSDKFLQGEQLEGVVISLINLEPKPGFSANPRAWGRFDSV